MTSTQPRRRTANQRLNIADDIRAIIGDHAMWRTGGVVTCQPRDIELVFHPFGGNPAWSGNTGKVCYPDKESCTAAAEEINAIEGATPVSCYLCPRGEHWHHVDLARKQRRTEMILARVAAAAARHRADQ